MHKVVDSVDPFPCSVTFVPPVYAKPASHPQVAEIHHLPFALSRPELGRHCAAIVCGKVMLSAIALLQM